MTEVEKPADLRGRGGAGSGRTTDGADAELHVGVEDPFRPARKAHPALVLTTSPSSRRRRALQRLGFEVDGSQRHTFPGHERLHTFDGHGNRVEVLAPG